VTHLGLQAVDTPSNLVTAWGLIDLVLALGLGLSVLVGAWRGLITEVLALMGWAVAYVAAQWAGPEAATHVPVGAPGTRINLLAGMVLVFVAAWLAWAALSWGVSLLLKASGLAGTDRLFGAGFGLLRGLLVALVVVTLVQMTPLAELQAWRESRGVGWLRQAIQAQRPLMPPAVQLYLPTQPGMDAVP
jgi:membrane protein required for colicin V production